MVTTHVKNVLSKYAQFYGTSSRAEYWTFFGFFWSLLICLSLLEVVLGTEIIAQIAYFGLLLPYLTCAVRRVRDASGNGWFVLIPIYNFVLLLSKSKTKDQSDI